MFCTNCGKAVKPDTRFCPHCGSGQTAEVASPAPPPVVPPLPLPPEDLPARVAPSPAMAAPAPRAATPSSGSKPALWAGGVAVVVALVGGVGYWGWNNKVAGEEAAQKLVLDEAARKAAAEESARKLAEEEQRRQAAEKAAEAAEITAAQAMLDKHIAAEEAEAQANAQGAGKARPVASKR